MVERLATGNDWSFERASDDEITILVTGRWTDYQLSYTWMGDIEALHLACAFDLRVPERRCAEVQALITLINERLWVGHFDHWVNEGIVMFRHALVLAGGTEASGKQCEALLGTALESCANATSRPSSSWFGPARPRVKRSTPRCSKHPGRHNGANGDIIVAMKRAKPADKPLRGLSGRLVLLGAGKMGSAMLGKAGWRAESTRASSPCSSRIPRKRSRRWRGAA